MAHLSALDSADTRALASGLARITLPTAILWGANDPFLPATIGRQLHRAIPRSTLEVIPNSKHFVPEEAAHQVAACISRLLQTG